MSALLPDGPVVFLGDDTEWSAEREMRAWMKTHDCSVGAQQQSKVRGVMAGSCAIAKWRNLSPAEREACDAYLIGSGRRGPLILPTEMPGGGSWPA